MSRIYANPFCWGRPVTGNHYLARTEEQNQILDAVERQISLIIAGRRGTGKTSLVKQVLEKSSAASIYLDLSFIVSREDLINLLLNAMEKSFPTMKQSGLSKALRPENGEKTFGPIFDLWFATVKQNNLKFILVWDEFHHLLKLKDNIIEELREELHNRRGMTHIVISHREDILHEIFSNSHKPFFNQSEFHTSKPIDYASFSRFLTRRFRRMGLSDFDLADAVLKFTGGHPQFTQEFAHTLAQLWLEGTSTRLMERTLAKMLENHDIGFSDNWDHFGLNEKRLLLGLASGQSRPTELGFIKKYKLSATSTAHNTVLKLLHEGWLINRDEGYHIFHPLFLKWLQKGKGLL